MTPNNPAGPRFSTIAWIAAALVTASVLPGVSAVARAQGPPRSQDESPQIEQLRPNFYLIAGAGGNIAVQVGDDGIVVVNTGAASMSDQVAAAVRRLAPGKGVVEIINTSSDADLIGGNAKLRAIRPAGWDATTVLSSQEALNRLISQNLPQDAQPGESMLLESQKPLYYNGEGIEVTRLPAAHSDGDLMVYFRRSDVLVVGDVIDPEHFPRIDLANGGSIQGEIDALNRIVQAAIPSIPFVFEPGGTLVISGHGHLYEQADVVQYRDMVTIIRDQVQALIGRKMTLAQVQQADPALGYEGQFGASSGPWTTQDFIATVYRGLVKQPAYAALERDTGVKFK
jgi:glyoxylase-like metal-dependent hydrolase (beta-lactamase superfamily II)